MKFLLTWARSAYNNRAAMSWISPKLQLAARPRLFNQASRGLLLRTKGPRGIARAARVERE
jgi:hypothetical protein